MRILVACEESQVVCEAFRRMGHEAYSCDLLNCSGGHPEWHLKRDALTLLDQPWDMILAFPPCTDLATSGARWFKQKQADGRQQRSIEFFLKFANARCDKTCIENPVGIMSTHFRKPDQVIQPWMFGHGECKATCFWLKGLPKLEPTNIVDGREQRIWRMHKGPTRAIERSKTFKGVAEALATQFSAFVNSGLSLEDWGKSLKGLNMSEKQDFFNKHSIRPEVITGGQH